MRFFLGGVTPSGFKNEFSAILNNGDYYGYILKGYFQFLLSLQF